MKIIKNKAIKSILALSIFLALGASSDELTKISIDSEKPSIQAITNADKNQLLLSVGVYDPLTEKFDFSKTKIKSKKSNNYSIVQFHDGKADSQWLAKQGIEVLGYLPNNAFIIANNKSSQNLKKSNNQIRWQGPYLSAFKVSPNLWQKNLNSLPSQINLLVTIFRNYPQNKIPTLISKHIPDVQFVSTYKSTYNDVLITVDSKNIEKVIETLASIEEVQYVGRSHKWQLENTEAVSAIQDNGRADQLPLNDTYIPSNTPIWDKGLLGSGQIVTVADTGLDSNEDWFVHYDDGTTITHEVTPAEHTTPPILGTLYPDRKVIANFIMPGAEAYDHAIAGYHGTHVSGSVAGDREIAIVVDEMAGSISSPTDSGYDNDDGMAPNAQLIMQDWGTSDEESGGGIFSMEALFSQAYDAGSRIHSNSWSSSSEDEPDGALGAYDGIARNTDRAIRTKEDMLVLFAAGNNDGQINSVSSPGTAKNVLTVGALLHGNSRDVADFSNKGPTDDNRIKPDIAATGSSIESAAGNDDNSNTISAPQRVALSGTSMATPITAGASALVRQYFTDGFYPTGVANLADQHIPTGPLLKATLINGAGITGGHFDKDTGWGRVYLTNSIMFDDSAKQLRAWEVTNDSGLNTGESIQFKLGVKEGTKFAATLAWYDLAGTLGASKSLVNDIDLSIQVNGETYLGNVFSGNGVSSTGGERDNINTIEQIRIPNPVEGIYTLTVSGINVPGDGSLNSNRQGFGLVATGDFDNIDSSPGPLTEINNLSSESQPGNGAKLSWDGSENADFYEIYRVEGTCALADFSHSRFVGNSESNTFTDTKTFNEFSYAYKVRAAQYKQLGSLSESCTEYTASDKPAPGLYYDKSRSGHGFVIEPWPNTDNYFTVFYTYKDDGTPEWYTSLSKLEDNVLVIDLNEGAFNGKLNRFTYDHNSGSGNPSSLDASIAGETNTLTIDFNTDSISGDDACTDGVDRGENRALASWDISGQQGDWCIAPLSNLTGPAPSVNDMGGTWYAGSSDSGWGLSMSYTETGVIIVTVYYYDESGVARWVQGSASGFALGQEITLDMKEFSGFGRTDTPISPTNVSAGSLTLTINDNNADDNDGTMSLNLTYQADNDSSSWSRTAVPVKIFTQAH